MSEASSERIVRIEKITLTTKRPREVGYNSRLFCSVATPTGEEIVTDPVVRIRTEGGTVGVGWSRIDRPGAEALLGKRVSDLFRLPDGAVDAGQLVDLPLWDLAAKLAGKPLYQLLGARGLREVELYDGSIYIDDLEAGDEQAVEIFREEVKTGKDYGFLNFKIKIGRGAQWMPIVEGLERDVLVIHTVREAAGAEAKILIDANNGMTVNIAKEVLDRCADLDIYWIEEPFAEDVCFNRALKAFIRERGYDSLVADGESGPPPQTFFDMVKRGDIDVVQHDLRAKGLTWWKATAAMIEPWGAECAPHCWGSYVERFAHAHFAASIPNFALQEAVPAEVSGVVLDGWEMADGRLRVPDTPGIGFDLEPEVIEAGVCKDDGFRVDSN